ncbi:hypothetical protein P8625_03110 [Tenacibaculum tangerinum]|uniref:Uncharacterized protein n=1 Tax=Tenacibaculum tangerinum TaxID=3038772 RepID=A0ABY8L6B4_9FLAO|nr:hypothetical protein [Tenacibaculum tangerinum]WGH76172.1 hypothetical protein P8625_03110 [Tenacibaculum tangerinum]
MTRIKKRIELRNYTLQPEREERIYVRPNFGVTFKQKGKPNTRFFRGDGNTKLSEIATVIKDTDCTISQHKINQIVEIIEK